MYNQQTPKKFRRFSNFISSLGFLSIAILGILYLISLPQCKSPLTYSVNSVDDRFGLSKAEIREIAEESADVWNIQSNRKLFLYNEKSKIKINLVYDSRQETLDKMNAQSQDISQNKESLDKQNQSLESALIEYKQRLADFNESVAYWNSKGGAPQSQYDILKEEESELEIMRQKINSLAKMLNKNIEEYNFSVDNFNQTINENKNKLITQGEYSRQDKTINVYTFGNKEELRFVLAHELGHSIGINHVENSLSLMYYMVQDQDISKPTLSEQDKEALDISCNFNAKIFEPNWDRIRIFLDNLRNDTTYISNQWRIYAREPI